MWRSQRSLIAALLLSVALNLLVGGALLGQLWDGRRPQGPPPLDWAARELSPELRDELRTHMRARMVPARPLREALRAASRDIGQLAGAQPLDREALAAALRRLREAQGDYQAFMHENLLDLVEKLPPEQRLELLREALQRHEGRRGPPRPPQSIAPQ
jgi:uncharacterized membrane protein